jgi:hypothetical protein
MVPKSKSSLRLSYKEALAYIVKGEYILRVGTLNRSKDKNNTQRGDI